MPPQRRLRSFLGVKLTAFEVWQPKGATHLIRLILKRGREKKRSGLGRVANEFICIRSKILVPDSIVVYSCTYSFTPVCRSEACPKSNKLTVAHTGFYGISFHRKGAGPGRAAPAAPGRGGHTDHDILRAASDLMVRLLLRCADNRRSGWRWRGSAVGFFWPARTLRCGWQPASATF